MLRSKVRRTPSWEMCLVKNERKRNLLEGEREREKERDRETDRQTESLCISERRREVKDRTSWEKADECG